MSAKPEELLESKGDGAIDADDFEENWTFSDYRHPEYSTNSGDDVSAGIVVKFDGEVDEGCLQEDCQANGNQLLTVDDLQAEVIPVSEPVKDIEEIQSTIVAPPVEAVFEPVETEVTSSHEKVELRIVESPVSHSATVGSETAALVTGTAIGVASAAAVATAATTTSKAKSPIAKKPVANTAAKKTMPAPAKPAPKAPAKKLEPTTRRATITKAKRSADAAKPARLTNLSPQRKATPAASSTTPSKPTTAFATTSINRVPSASSATAKAPTPAKPATFARTTTLTKRVASTPNSALSFESIGDLCLGGRVIVTNSQGSKAGILRYLGTAEFAAGQWAGVELDEPLGKNDGVVAGTRYFKCEARYGLFASVRNVSCFPANPMRRDASAKDSMAATGCPTASQSLKELSEECCDAGAAMFDEETATVVFFASCVSPDEICLRTSEMQQKLETLRNAMNLHYTDVLASSVANKKKIKVKFNVGDLCAAYIDHHWWRVTVTHTDAFEYEVLLLDAGCRRRAPKRNVFPLFGFNRYSSPLVIRVSLGIYPPSILGWNELVGKFITDKLEAANSIVIKDFKSEPVILLYKIESGRKINLSQELVSSGFGRWDKAILPIPKLCAAWKPAELFERHAAFCGFVTSVSDGGELFLCNVENKLEQIGKALADVYELTDPKETNLTEGDICIARYRNSSWRRAVVVLVEKQKVYVQYADYGQFQWVNRCDVRPETILEEVPIQGNWCVLHNIRLIGGETAVNRLRDFTLEQQFRVRVEYTGPPIGVVLRKENLLTSTSFVVSNLLVSEGLAEKT